MRQVVYYTDPRQRTQQPYQTNIQYQPTYNRAEQQLIELRQNYRQKKQSIKQAVRHPITYIDQFRFRDQRQYQLQKAKQYKAPSQKPIFFQAQRKQPDYLGRQIQRRRHAKGLQNQQKLKNHKNKNQYQIIVKSLSFNRRQSQNSFQNTIGFLSEIRYKIVPAQSPKMSLDVTSQTDHKYLIKGNLVIWQYHGGPNQLFYLQPANNNGWYHIISSSTGFLLQVQNSQTANQAMLIMSPRVGNQAEKFQIQPYGSDLFRIRTFCNKYLDIKHDWIRNGQAIIQYSQNNGKNQKWKIVPS